MLSRDVLPVHSPSALLTRHCCTCTRAHILQSGKIKKQPQHADRGSDGATPCKDFEEDFQIVDAHGAAGGAAVKFILEQIAAKKLEGYEANFGMSGMGVGVDIWEGMYR